MLRFSVLTCIPPNSTYLTTIQFLYFLAKTFETRTFFLWISTWNNFTLLAWTHTLSPILLNCVQWWFFLRPWDNVYWGKEIREIRTSLSNDHEGLLWHQLQHTCLAIKRKFPSNLKQQKSRQEPWRASALLSYKHNVILLSLNISNHASLKICDNSFLLVLYIRWTIVNSFTQSSGNWIYSRIEEGVLSLQQFIIIIIIIIILP